MEWYFFEVGTSLSVSSAMVSNLKRKKKKRKKEERKKEKKRRGGIYGIERN
jgi:hypothetical protein